MQISIGSIVCLEKCMCSFVHLCIPAVLSEIHVLIRAHTCMPAEIHSFIECEKKCMYLLEPMYASSNPLVYRVSREKCMYLVAPMHTSRNRLACPGKCTRLLAPSRVGIIARSYKHQSKTGGREVTRKLPLPNVNKTNRLRVMSCH